ncbi:MAG: FtsX-like permease family protein [Pseudomonadales bacterium]|nr:FtsX-like permease family protein [Pseudomonadales bacterium]
MFSSYLKLALRNLAKYRVYSAINIFGLGIGLTATLLLSLYLVDEFSFDRMYTKSDRIYRVLLEISLPGQDPITIDNTPGALAPQLAADYPEIESQTQLFVLGRADITYQESSFYENYTAADPAIFDMFDYEFIQGDAGTALDLPNGVILTESTATKYFGDEDAMGKLLQSNRGEFIVTAVMQDPPLNSHIQFSMLFGLPSEVREQFFNWEDFFSNSFILLSENASIANLEAKLPEFVETRVPDELKDSVTFRLQPLTEMHFGSSDIQNSFSNTTGSLSTIYTLAGIGFLILFIACINYINLATARSINRAKEIGLRKVVGAERNQLVVQFLSESILLTLFAFVFALVATQALLPIFNGFTLKSLSMTSLLTPSMGGLVIALSLMVGISAGLYPAVYLANTRVLLTLQRQLKSGSKSLSLRKTLVVAQFAMSITLLVATLIAMQQMEFIRAKPLGFETENLVVIDINSGPSRSGYEAIKNEFLSHPNVQSASVSTRVPGEWKNIVPVNTRRDGQLESDSRLASFMGMDQDFIGTFALELIQGRNLDRGEADMNNIVVNEALIDAMGWQLEDAVGQSVVLSNRELEDYPATIVGIVRDFNFRSLHEEIAPLVLGYSHTSIQSIDYFTARISAVNVSETLEHLEASQARYDPETPFEFHFLDEQIDLFYRADELTTILFSIAASLALFIACLGLYGLSAFATEQRTKEIGIRKVLGASIGQLLKLMSLDFIKLVLIANLIAWPLVYYLMSIWLNGFAYAQTINLTSFVLAALFLLVATIVTVSGHTIRVALANPIDSLRYE